MQGGPRPGCGARARPAGRDRARFPGSHVRPPATTPARTPLPAGSRRARSRVTAAADGHRPVVHLQADGTAELRLQAAVTARGTSRRLPLLRRSHQTAEHRHPRPGRRRRPLSRPGGRRHRRDGAALASPLGPPVLRHDSGRFAGDVISARRLSGTVVQTSPSMCQAGEDYAEPAQRDPPPVPRPG